MHHGDKAMAASQQYQGNRVGLNNANNAISKSSASPIENVMGDINRRLDVAQERITDLRKRLEPVSGPQGETITCGTGNALDRAPSPPKAPLERDLGDIDERVASMCKQLSYLLDYLHV